MVVDTISDFLVSNNYTKKFIAIDYGLKHIGMAISDPSNIISVPYGTFTETLLFEKIIEIITNENVHGVVIGKPYHLDGSLSEMVNKVEIFAEKIEKIISILFLLSLGIDIIFMMVRLLIIVLQLKKQTVR